MKPRTRAAILDMLRLNKLEHKVHELEAVVSATARYVPDVDMRVFVEETERNDALLTKRCRVCRP